MAMSKEEVMAQAKRQSEHARLRNKLTMRITQISNGFLVTAVGSGQAHSYPSLDLALKRIRAFYECEVNQESSCG